MVKIKVNKATAGDRVRGWTEEKSELPQEEGVLSDKTDTGVVTLQYDRARRHNYDYCKCES